MFQYLEKNYQLLMSIILFLAFFYLIQYDKPSYLYNKDGSIRSFGVGYKNKTILPIWLLSIVLGIICYIFIKYYTALHYY